MKNRTRLLTMTALALAAVGFSVPLAAAQSGKSQSGKSNTEANKALVRKSFDAWRTGTGNPFELLDDNASWTITGKSVASKRYPNKEAFLREVIRPFNARMKGHLVPTVHRIYAEGDSIIIHFDADGTARDGKPYHNTYAWFFEFKGNKVVNAVAFFDSVEFNDFWKRVSPAVTN
jgi:ketosteroid isomerase-like protein